MKTFMNALLLMSVLVMASCASLPWANTSAAVENVDVDTQKIVRTIDRNPLGMNVNYLRDDPANWKKAKANLWDILKDMNVKWMRYPGGEKSDHFRFSSPPYNKSAAVVKPTRDRMYERNAVGYDLLEFDEFMEAVKKVGAEPVIVVAYDSYHFSQTKLDEFIEHAKSWIRYANITKKYNIKYWEVGNENWLGASKNPIEKRSEEVVKMAKAMREVDPTIKIGASGVEHEIAGDDLDFFTFSNYDNFIPMKEYRERKNYPLVRWLDSKKKLKDAGEEVFLAEFNSVSFKMPRQWNHDVAHCLQLFDMMGQIVSEETFDCAMLWGTRWMEEEHSAFIWYLVDEKNNLTPIGHVFKMWCKHIKPNVVGITGPKQTCCFALHDPKTGELSVMMVNKSDKERIVKINTGGSYSTATHEIFSGTHELDNWGTMKETQVRVDAKTTFTLPPESASTITFR